MPWFDSLCTAFGTAGTGGFGIKADSLASYSPYLQNVTTVFMFLFGVNFSCYYLIFIKRIKDVFKDTYELTFSQESYEALQDINTWCRKNGNYTADYDVADYILIDPLKAVYPDKVTLK